MPREILMRVLALTILTIWAVSVAPAVRAQTYDPNYPVCLQVYSDMGGYIACSYLSLAQCAQSASGRAAQCYNNPYYAGPTPAPGRNDRQHRSAY